MESPRTILEAKIKSAMTVFLTNSRSRAMIEAFRRVTGSRSDLAIDAIDRRTAWA